MPSTSDNNKRIAKNTLMLYFRMILLMLISLYTSRVNLNALGVEDYGIYNVVGGVVAMFSLISGRLSSAISRFITFELGRGDHQRLKDIFSASVTIQLVLSLLIIVLLETIGLWFLNTHLVIPAERLKAANWVFQFSVLTFVINLISVPYNACIIAHEKMSAFAYISILEAAGKLAVALLIVHSPIDRLIFFAAMLCGIAVLLRLVYGWYCTHHFSECHYHPRWDGQLLRQMFSFAGWNFIAGSAGLINNTGVNVMMNLFFGVTVNAARGVATQVNAHVYQFVTNFTMALNPQITKSYAQGDFTYMHSLVCRGAKFSYFLILIFLIPICLEAHQILHLWLGIVPDYAVPFVQLTLMCTAINVLSSTIITSIHATGNIRRFMIIVGAVEITNFPLVYIAFRLGASPLVAYYIYIVIYFILMFLRFYLTKDLIHMKASLFIKGVYLKALIVTLLAAILPVALRLAMTEETLLRFLLVCLVSFASSFAIIYYVGLEAEERGMIMRMIRKKILHKT